MKRILLDRSIFHGTKFDQLQDSSLVKHAADGDLEVLFTPMFLEETLMHGLSDKMTFISHWKYLSSINNQQWFKLAEDIIAIELGNKLVDEKYYLQYNRLIEDARNRVESFIAGERIDGFQQMLSKIEDNKSIRRKNRQTRLDLRYETPQGNFKFNEFFESNVEWFIEKGIMAYHQHSERFLDIWRTQRGECPFTDSFIRTWLSTIFLAAVDHNLRVSENDRADAEQLAFLLWADTMVSDDTRFMKSAFDLLYSGTEKSFMTLSELLSYLNNERVPRSQLV